MGTLEDGDGRKASGPMHACVEARYRLAVTGVVSLWARIFNETS